jgi:hypothetical protein
VAVTVVAVVAMENITTVPRPGTRRNTLVIGSAKIARSLSRISSSELLAPRGATRRANSGIDGPRGDTTRRGQPDRSLHQPIFIGVSGSTEGLHSRGQS